MFERKKDAPICGGVTEEKWEGYSEEIKSNEIIFFEYNCIRFTLKAKIEDNKLHIEARGGNGNERDGTRFIVDFFTDDLSLMKELNDLIIKNEISKNNGYTREVAGLPAGLGDYIIVEYASGEKIYKYCNQSLMVSEETADEFYNAFHKVTRENGYKFSTEGSNVKVYDDADEEYLQGRWNGTHFGDRIRAEFTNNRVKIYCNDKLLDDTEYVIYEGNIRVNKLIEGKKEAKSEYDYEEFTGCSSLRKKNENILTAYFTKESYSTCELLKEEEKEYE